jgi:hypothetical protein
MGMMVHIYNPSTQKMKAGDYEFKVSLGYIWRSCLKTQNKQKTVGG